MTARAAEQLKWLGPSRCTFKNQKYWRRNCIDSSREAKIDVVVLCLQD